MPSTIRKLVTRLLAGTFLATHMAAAIPAITPATTAPSPSETATQMLVQAAPPPAPTVPRRVLGIYENAQEICGPISGGAANPVIAARIERFTQTLSHSQTGRDLLTTAKQYDRNPAWMCFDNDMGSLHAAYFMGAGVLSVNAAKSDDAIIGDATHELRHLFQEKSGSSRIIPISQSDGLHIEYAKEAESEATAALVMWELKQAGISGPWNHHNNPYNYGPNSICYARITDTFSAAINRGATPPEATLAAFRSWYDDGYLLNNYKKRAMDRYGWNRSVTIAPSSSKRPALDLAHAHAPANTDSNAAPPLTSCTDARTAAPRVDYGRASDYINSLLTSTLGELPSYGVNFIGLRQDLRSVLETPVSHAVAPPKPAVA